MKTTHVLAIMFLLTESVAFAQQQLAPQSIAFRLTEWKSMHFDNAADATLQLQTLKKLGCEAQSEEHSGHIDVRFRALRWTKVSLDTQKLADQWESWFRTNGFETLHGHDEAPAQGAVAVHYVMVQPRTLHVSTAEEAQEFAAIFTGLGCTVQSSRHAGHIDLKISCTKWRNLVFGGHDEAHAIQKWLDEQGFQTQHNH